MSMPTPAPLPERPDLAQLRRRAKELLASARSGDPAALQRLRQRRDPRLADAQFAIAREHGFASWPRLKSVVDATAGVVTRANIANAHLAPSRCSAETFLDGARRNGWEPGRLPSAVIFVFQNVFARNLEHDDRFVEDPSMAVGNGRYFVTRDDPAIAVSAMSPGSAFVGQVENQVALGGAGRFVIINLAGGLGRDVRSGDVAVAESAVRDDGVSHRYLPPGDVVDADEALTDALLAAARTVREDARTHVSWTNPATFRQPQAETDHYAAQGVTIVESEIASLLAVTAALGVAGAQSSS